MKFNYWECDAVKFNEEHGTHLVQSARRGWYKRYGSIKEEAVQSGLVSVVNFKKEVVDKVARYINDQKVARYINDQKCRGKRCLMLVGSNGDPVSNPNTFTHSFCKVTLHCFALNSARHSDKVARKKLKSRRIIKSINISVQT